MDGELLISYILDTSKSLSSELPHESRKNIKSTKRVFRRRCHINKIREEKGRPKCRL